MQRQEEDGVIISCDFCQTDWDQVKNMIEGHRGSFPAPGVICLDCLKSALEDMQVLEGQSYACTMCRKERLPTSVAAWVGPAKIEPPSIVCDDCIKQAAGAFGRDKDIDWTWRPQTK